MRIRFLGAFLLAVVAAVIPLEQRGLKFGHAQAQMLVAIPFQSPAAGGGLLRSDNFNRTDTTNNIGTPSDSGSAWSQTSGAWGISTNRGYESGGGAQRVAALEASVADVDVQVTIQTVGTDFGIVARLADNSNYLVCIGSGSNVFMYKNVAGSFTQLGSTVGYVVANGDVLKFTVHGSTLNLYVNGTLKIGPITDGAGATNTKHGLRTNSDTTTRFDDFSITAN